MVSMRVRRWVRSIPAGNETSSCSYWMRPAPAERRCESSASFPTGQGDGNFLRPSLVLDPDPAQRVVTEEQFGPTVPIIPFDDVEDAIVAANDTWAGLCSSVWTSNPQRAADVGARLSSGYTWVNGHGAAFLDERAPFGGWRSSGMGREMGIEGLREFMDTHSVSFPEPAS